MNAFQFVNHESFPEDKYIAEAVTLCFDGKFRATYIRKKLQNGGMFWSEVSAAVQQHGEKKYLKGFSQDSNFVQDDIKAFLENRSWEKGGSSSVKSSGGYVAQNKSDDEIPF